MKTAVKVIIIVFLYFWFRSSSALECQAGVDGRGQVTLRKINYPPIFECCFKFAEVIFPRFAVYGAVPPSLTKQACFQAGQCFFSKELNKNVCVCANADDLNCQSGPIKIQTDKTASRSPK